MTIEQTPEFQRREQEARVKYDEAIGRLLFASVVPIYDIFEDKPGITGSATMIFMHGRSFFVTAGHVLLHNDGIYLATRGIDSNGTERFVTLPSRWHITLNPESYSDPDIAFCEVPNDFLNHFQRIEIGEPQLHQSYDIAGFMAKDVSLNEDTARMRYQLSKIGLVIAPDKVLRRWNKAEQIREFNIVLAYDRLTGKSLPEALQGISGGPVVAATLINSTKFEFAYQGLITRRGEKNIKLFICTRASFIRDAIQQIYFGGEKVWDFTELQITYPESWNFPLS